MCAQRCAQLAACLELLLAVQQLRFRIAASFHGSLVLLNCSQGGMVATVVKPPAPPPSALRASHWASGRVLEASGALSNQSGTTAGALA